MGLLSNLLERRAHPSQPDQWLINTFGQGLETGAGPTVTPLSSLGSTAVYACIRVLAESVASLPLPLYRRQADDGKERATDHPLYPILHDLPNPEMTSFQLRETMVGHQSLWGNTFAEIEINRGGQIRALWPLRPDLTIVRRINRRIVYDILMPQGPNIRLPWEKVMHIPALSMDGVVGLSPISLAREAVGLALGTEEFGARFFGNGARPGIVLEHPGQLSQEAQSRLRKSVETRHQGLSNAHRLMILEEGMALKEVGIPPEDAQFLETRKFQTTEIARIFRVPPHLIGDLERATFSNVEQQSLDFVIHTLRPWLVRWEQAISRDLLMPAERVTYFAEHLVAGLLRGDTQSRYEAYSTGRQNGWLSANDIRKLENMNPVEGGDQYLIPLNTVAVGTPTDSAGRMFSQENMEARNNPAREQAAQARQQLAGSYQTVMADATNRVIRREVADVGRAIGRHLGKRSLSEFSAWLSDFYRDHKEFWERQLLPLLTSYADLVGAAVAAELETDALGAAEVEQFIADYLAGLAERQTSSSHLQLTALIEEALAGDDDPAEAMEGRLAEWQEWRGDQVARDETAQAGNALAKSFYLLAGVSRLRWVARGENCPYCDDMNGRVVGIQQNFLNKNDDYQPDGADRPLSRRSNVGHPPLHKGCDCQIVADRD